MVSAPSGNTGIAQLNAEQHSNLHKKFAHILLVCVRAMDIANCILFVCVGRWANTVDPIGVTFWFGLANVLIACVISRGYVLHFKKRSQKRLVSTLA